MLAQLLVQVLRHLMVQGRHDLRRELHHMHLRDALHLHLLRELEPDEAAAADDHSVRVFRGHPLLNSGGVLHASKCEVAAPVDPRDRRHEGVATHREHEVVVFVRRLGTGRRLAHGDRLGGPVDRHDLHARVHVEVEATPQHLRLRNRQCAPELDLPAEVVGQAAVGERDVAALLEDRDLYVFAQAAEPRRRTGACRRPTDDDNARHGGRRPKSEARSELHDCGGVTGSLKRT
mmetsp:Transcript_92998/g.268605  ORF Transcript_92998/g.268605 Transcript_92998/m.268605 type:complete len:233 (-) Transcript_92998:2-700(-)